MDQRLHCAVCKEWSLVEHILSFRCGHCFCVPCIANWKDAGGNRCPSCRYIIKNDPGHRLYITIRDADILSSEDGPASDGLSAAVVKQVKYVTKRLDRMDATASLKTVKKAEENLVKLADVLQADGLVEELLAAISNFKERVIPVYATLDDRQRQINELRAQQTIWEHDNERQLLSLLSKIEALEDCRRNWQAEQMHARCLADEAISSAEKAKNETLALRQENEKLLDERAKVLKNIAREKEKDEELKKYKCFCDKYKKKETSTKAKMKGLREENSNLKQQLDRLRSQSDVDESLRVVDRSYLIDEDFDGRESENMQPDFDLAVDDDSHRRRPLRFNTPPFPIRKPMIDCPPAPINRDDIDLDDFRPVPTYKSDWTLSRPTKKRKTESEPAKSDPQLGRLRLPPLFPLKLDSKGHTKGTVQLGSRVRMGK